MNVDIKRLIMEENIKVSARFRPLLVSDGPDRVVCKLSEDSVTYFDVATGNKTLQFDHVFGDDATNHEVYDTTAKRVVDNVLDGYNGTIIAYGQTGSGKTYSIMGAKEKGVLSHAIYDIFGGIEDQDARSFLLRMSYLEIYKEKIYDLLDDQGVNLKIIQEEPIVIQNLTEVIVDSPEAIFDELSRGETNRHYRATDMNERSSRSHTIFRLTIESQDEETENVNVSCLTLVDLAGSERQGNARTTGESLKEGASINKSLLALREVISQLTKNRSSKFIPYRNSKLTRILRQALGGNAVTSLICCVNSCKDHEQESLNTLHFGVMCQRVQNNAVKNEVGDDHALLRKYKKQVEELKAELSMQRERTKSIEYELEEKSKEVLLHDEEEDDDDGETDDIATKYALRAQRWWRKAELERLQQLRVESEQNQQLAKELEEKIELMETQQLSSNKTERKPMTPRTRRLSYVINSIDTAKHVLQFANQMKKGKETSELEMVKADRERVAKVLEETLKKLENETNQVEQLRKYLKSVEQDQEKTMFLPQDRLDAIAKWEQEMRQWHADSEKYNEETDERARIVEEEAERVQLELEELERKETSLNHKQQQLKQKQQQLELWEKQLKQRQQEQQDELQSWEDDLVAKEQDVRNQFQELSQYQKQTELKLKTRKETLDQLELEIRKEKQLCVEMQEQTKQQQKQMEQRKEAHKYVHEPTVKKADKTTEAWVEEFLKDSESIRTLFESITSFTESTVTTNNDNNNNNNKDRKHLNELTKSIGDILKVSIPIIVDGQMTAQDLTFRKRLLSRYLSETKMILLKAAHQNN